ncbi:hypothetical protein ACL02U_22980 [Streptomyces sp. MS06]|uniref:hypothetical protein n=1 Tax=Streptomyces sp. MS06 TaxID=3385974 RepID=UPI0039A3126B
MNAARTKAGTRTLLSAARRRAGFGVAPDHPADTRSAPSTGSESAGTTARAARPSRTPYRLLRFALPAAVAAVITTAVVATPAAADVPYTSVVASNSGGAWWRAAPNLSGQKMNYLYNGTPLHMYCWITGQTVSPPDSDYTSDRWFKVGTPYVSGQYYIHSSLVDHQTTVGYC